MLATENTRYVTTAAGNGRLDLKSIMPEDVFTDWDAITHQQRSLPALLQRRTTTPKYDVRGEKREETGFSWGVKVDKENVGG